MLVNRCPGLQDLSWETPWDLDLRIWLLLQHAIWPSLKKTSLGTDYLPEQDKPIIATFYDNHPALEGLSY